MIYAGFDLSYETERVVSGQARDLAGAHATDNLCVVVINDEMA
jgi:precorrin-6B methylase 1